MWKNKRRGTALIHTFNDFSTAIVENNYGIKYKGAYFDSLESAKKVVELEYKLAEAVKNKVLGV